MFLRRTLLLLQCKCTFFVFNSFFVFFNCQNVSMYKCFESPSIVYKITRLKEFVTGKESVKGKRKNERR